MTWYAVLWADFIYDEDDTPLTTVSLDCDIAGIFDNEDEALALKNLLYDNEVHSLVKVVSW